MARFAVIDPAGVVVNVVEYDPPTAGELAAAATDEERAELARRIWSPPDGHELVASDEASIGETYTNGAFSPSAEV